MFGIVQNSISHAFFRIEVGNFGNAKRLDFLSVRNRKALAVDDFFFVDQVEQWLGIRKIKAVYKLDVNEFRGNRSLQFILQYFEKLG